MRGKILFWIILVLTTLSIFIILPKEIPISFDSPRIPFINKKISIHKKLIGFDSRILLSRFGIKKNIEFRKGLDLQGGTSITLKASMKDIPQSQRQAALDSVKRIVEKRVNFSGLVEPVIQTARVNDEYRIIVEIPGITDVSQAVSLVGRTAKLEFRELTPQATQSAYLLYEDTKALDLSGADLKDAQVSFDQTTSNPVVLFTVQPHAQEKFYKATQKLIQKPMAICLDQQCFSAPVVQQAIRDSGQISGQFTIEQAKELADQLNAGALPVSLSVLEQRTIGATLGEESLKKSLFAGVLGFVLIVIFMCVLYGRLGGIASFALVLYTIFTLAIFKLIPVTLTLAGIAGFILSIGMAVDANILIFERMREEIRRGKPLQVAMELGFIRAWTSIRDSNISSIITSLILFYFGTGTVRGFAITLLIGVLVSMFSAITVTRTFLRLLYR